MLAVQYQFMPTMLQGPAYNCSSYMPPGPAWAERFGIKQIPFGIYSIVFGLTTEILYIPCTLGLRKDMKTSCFKIMFWLSILDMIAIMANCVLFGVLLLEGAVYCSNPVMTLGVGIVGYWIWCTASACCLVLGLNRLFEMLNLSRYFSSTLTNIYIGICCAYGLFMTLFTRPVIVNSTLQSMFFSPMIPNHIMEEYVNWPHAVHNIVVACSSCLLYVSLSAVLAVKSRSILADGSRTRVISNTPVFIQVMLICGANLVGTSIYVYMNFMPAPPAVIIAGQVAWQYIHDNCILMCNALSISLAGERELRNGLPPFIYLALNKSIRQFALKSIGLGNMYETQRVTNISLTQGTR